MKAKDRNNIIQYCFGNEIEYLQDLGRKLEKDSIVVMLGIGPALMALALLEGATETFELYGIDIKDFTGLAHLAEEGFEGRLKALRGLSWAPALVEQFKDESLDLLIVDAAHDWLSVDRDIAAWWKKVKIGGIVFFHDYVPLEENNGVRVAIDTKRTLFWKEMDRPGISIVYQRVG